MEKKKTMKRIEAIIKGHKFTDTPFGLKKKQIRRALEAAADNAEKQKENASIAYEGLFSRMAEEDADYHRIIAEMLRHKQTIINAEATIKAISEIRADLEAEVTVDETED